MLTVEGTMVDDIDPEIEGMKSDKDLQYLLKRIDPIEFNAQLHDELVIFSTRNHLHHRRLYPLIAARLCQKDIPCYFLFYNEQIARTFPDLTIRNVQVSNSLRQQEEHYLFRSGQIGYPRFDWIVDLENGRITVEGLEDINFFPVFRCTLQKDYRRYNIDYSDPEVARKIQRGLFTADEVLRYCQLYLDFAHLHDIDIRFIAWEQTYLPHGLFNIFSQSEKNKNKRLQYVNVGTEYAHYFSSREDFPYNIGSTNLTTRSLQSKWGGYSEEFEEYYERVRSSKSLSQSIKEEIHSDLTNNILGKVEDSVKLSDEMSSRLKNHLDYARESGNNIFCLFSHQFYDTPLDDSGPFSDTMCEWIDQTIEIFKERDDILLLKPHPAEVEMPNEEWIPDETLDEYLGDTIDGHENIMLLGPDALNSIAVYQQIDCGLLWRSTVGVEMMSFGIPQIVSGKPPWFEYLNPIRPNSLSKYEEMIQDPSKVTVTPEDQTRAVVYLHWLKNYMHYFLPHIRNLDYGKLDPRKVRWDRDALQKLLNGYSPNIDALIDEFNLSNFDSGRSFEDKMSEPYENTALSDEVEIS